MISVRTCLLLLPFSVVAMGQAECPFPVLNGKTVLSSESRLKNEFPDGSTALMECAKGYEKRDGSPLITCLNGVWTAVKLICQRIDCGPPIPSPHMQYLTTDGTLFGAYAKPICDTGYGLEGSSHRQCLVSGWSGKSECVLIVCDEPSKIEHGDVKFPNPVPLYKDVIEYSCHNNYTLVGNKFITCEDTWEYNLPPPECKAIISNTSADTTTDIATTAKSTATSIATSTATYGVIMKTTTITTATTATTTTSATTTHEQQEHLEIANSMNNFKWAIGVIICTLAILGVLLYLLHYNLKHKGPNNRTAPLL